MSKRRRPKRLFPAKYSASHIPTPRIDHNKAAAYNLQRSKATTGQGPNTEPRLDNNFMEDVPRTRGLSTYDFSKEVWVRSETGKTKDRKHELMIVEGKDLFGLYRIWQSQMRSQGVSEYFCMAIKKTEGYVLNLFFSGNEYLFVKETRGIRSISMTYIGRNEAMERYYSNRIVWRLAEPIQI